jgi:hypothetical protein
LFFADRLGGFTVFQVYERSMDLGDNVAQSKPLHMSGLVDRVKMVPKQTDSIMWEVSADAGANWQGVTDTLWADLASPGTELCWRATLLYTKLGAYPTCDEIQFEFMDDIVSTLIERFAAVVCDVGVELSWEISSDDAISGFEIYRGLGAGEMSDRVNAGGMIPAEARSYVDEIADGRTYTYTLRVVLADGSTVESGTVTAGTPVRALSLEQNYPNPFNPTTTITFGLPAEGMVELVVYDLEGRLVRRLAHGPMTAGLKEVSWDGRDDGGNAVGSGVYLYQLKAGTRTLAKKMVLLK